MPRKTTVSRCSVRRVDEGDKVVPQYLYRFYLTLNNVTLADGSPFSLPPASLRGNVANLTRPEEPALGYFLAAEVDERTARVP